jgi:hypothetical protein
MYSVSIPLHTTTKLYRSASTLVHCILPSTTSIFQRNFQLPTPIWYGLSLNYLPRLSFMETFIAKHIVLGSDLNDDRGVLFHDLFSRFNLSLLNSGANTHFCLASRTSSALDITFCSPCLSTHLECPVLCDLHCSDHVPVTVHICIFPPL